jgi:hypothetical protein
LSPVLFDLRTAQEIFLAGSIITTNGRGQNRHFQIFERTSSAAKNSAAHPD